MSKEIKAIHKKVSFLSYRFKNTLSFKRTGIEPVKFEDLYCNIIALLTQYFIKNRIYGNI